MNKKNDKSIFTLIDNEKAVNYMYEQAKDVLYYCYKNEKSFPRNCDVVSTILTIMIYRNEDMRTYYDIFYIRGHYRNNSASDTCFQYSPVRIPKKTRLVSTECIFCNCEYMVAHSWIELIDKKTKESFIVDFTSSQFHEDIGDLEQHVLSNDLNKEELFESVRQYSNFFINRENPDYYYICDEKFCTAKELYDSARENYLNNDETELNTKLAKMNYLEFLNTRIK